MRADMLNDQPVSDNARGQADAA